MAGRNTKDITKRPEGRPTKFTDDTVKKLESIFKIGGTVDEATTYAGITRQSYYNYIEKDQSFLTKMEAAQHYADVVAKNVVIDSIVKDRDLGSAKWWLEKREFKSTATNPSIQINTFIKSERDEFGI